MDRQKMLMSQLEFMQKRLTFYKMYWIEYVGVNSIKIKQKEK